VPGNRTQGRNTIKQFLLMMIFAVTITDTECILPEAA
jgi:hypothetical protein